MPLPLFSERAKCVNPYLSPFGFTLHCARQHILSAREAELTDCLHMQPKTWFPELPHDMTSLCKHIRRTALAQRSSLHKFTKPLAGQICGTQL